MKPILLVLILLVGIWPVNAKKMIMKPVPISGKYILKKMWDGHSVLRHNNSRYVIRIDQNAQSIQANFGCNNMNGPFQTNRYIIEQPIYIVATEMFCTQSIHDMEQLFGRGMSQVNHFTINGTVLRFYQDEQLIFEFRKSRK